MWKCSAAMRYGLAGRRLVHGRATDGIRVSVRRCIGTADDRSEQHRQQRHVTLYERGAERNLVARSALGVSVFNTVYWTWYLFDFIPAVNVSPVQDMYIDPTVGYLGMGLGILINIVTVMYPSVSVSRITVPVDQTFLRVHRLSLPFVVPSEAYNDYRIGELYLQRRSTETKKILEADSFDRFRGHLPLFVEGKNVPLLMEVRDGSEIRNSDLLLEALVYHDDAVKAAEARHKKASTDADVPSTAQFVSSVSPQQPSNPRTMPRAVGKRPKPKRRQKQPRRR